MPVQGVAASAMLLCGPGHERMMQGLVLGAQAAVAGRADEPRHDLAVAGHAAHEHAVQVDSVASEPSADADGGIGLFQPHGEFSCSACAACCSVLALPSGFALPEDVSPVHPMRATSSTPVASHQSDGPERPPRVFLV